MRLFLVLLAPACGLRGERCEAECQQHSCTELWTSGRHDQKEMCSACSPANACDPQSVDFFLPNATGDLGTLFGGLTACSTLEAAVSRHTHWFHIQQHAERTFVKQLPELCKVGGANYYAKLQQLREPMQAAINRHVRSAFIVKAACTSMGYFMGADEPETVICNEPILRHEPFNLAEGRWVVNLTLHLLQRGPLQCKDQDEALLARWEAELEAVLKYHRSNMAFERLWGRYRGRCLVLQTSPLLMSEEARSAAPTLALMSRAVDDHLHHPADAVETVPRPCVNANSECRAQPSQPLAMCNGCLEEWIYILGNNTLVLLEVARRALDGHLGPSGICWRGTPATVARAAVQREWDGLDGLMKANGYPLPTNFEPESSGIYVSLTLTTVYHKLSSYCGSAITNRQPRPTQGILCNGAEVNAGSAHSPIVDVTPSTNLDRCHGEACAAAASAISSYHSLLERISPLRTWLLALLYKYNHGAASAPEEYNERGASLMPAVRERLSMLPCDASFLEHVGSLLALPPVLHETLALMRASIPHLEISPVASGRQLSVLIEANVTEELLELLRQAGGERHMAKDGGGLRITFRRSSE